MTTYRPGTHWKITIVEEGDGPLDEHGHHVDSRLRAVVMDGKVLTTDAELAGRVCALLNADELRHPRPPYPPFCSCGLCGPIVH